MLVLLSGLSGVLALGFVSGIVAWWMTEDVSTEEVLHSRFSKVALGIVAIFIILVSLASINGGPVDRYQLSLYVIGERGEQAMIHSSTYRSYGSCRRSRNGMVDNASLDEHRAGVVAICTSISRDNLETPETF